MILAPAKWMSDLNGLKILLLGGTLVVRLSPPTCHGRLPSPLAPPQVKKSNTHTRTDFHLPLSIRAVWAKNFVERFMEIRPIFIILLVTSLFNLVHMQRNYCTWSEYFQESHIRRVENFFLLLWAANLRNMCYNCRTIPKHFTLISIATGIRAGFALFFFYKQSGKYHIGSVPEKYEMLGWILRRTPLTAERLVHDLDLTQRKEYRGHSAERVERNSWADSHAFFTRPWHKVSVRGRNLEEC